MQRISFRTTTAIQLKLQEEKSGLSIGTLFVRLSSMQLFTMITSMDLTQSLKSTIGTRNKIHILHRNDKRAPPVHEFLKQGTWKLIQKFLFFVCNHRYQPLLCVRFGRHFSMDRSSIYRHFSSDCDHIGLQLFRFIVRFIQLVLHK
ncbi:hypothetical protein SDC9_139813 [bioreactor metagenome]|uniref:Uncharacterized protein n=1 Tax=bioreactor metagenome TaxID=1076179 RepID=A0A645DU66_9ZZZZ